MVRESARCQCARTATLTKAERDAVISQAGLTDTPAKNIGDNFLCPASAPAEEQREVTVV
jgi:hypothetical protein